MRNSALSVRAAWRRCPNRLPMRPTLPRTSHGRIPSHWRGASRRPRSQERLHLGTPGRMTIWAARCPSRPPRHFQIYRLIPSAATPRPQ